MGRGCPSCTGGPPTAPCRTLRVNMPAGTYSVQLGPLPKSTPHAPPSQRPALWPPPYAVGPGRRSTALLTACCFGDVVRHHGVHADVRVDGDGEAKHKVRGLLEDAALWGVGGRREVQEVRACEEVAVGRGTAQSTPCNTRNA